jgi:hypothetical protein
VIRRASLLVAPLYVVLTLALTWPLACEATRAVPRGSLSLDALMQAYILEWDWRTLPRDPTRVFDAPNFHPERRTLTYMDHLIGEAVLGWPVRASTHSLPLAQNFLVVFSFVSTAWITYRLARCLGASRPGAFLSGCLYTFCGYRLGNLANVNQLQTELVVVGLFFGVRFVFGRRRLRDGALALLAIAAQSWFGWYYFYHLVVALGLLAPFVWLGRGAGRPPVPWRAMAALAAGALLLVLPSAWPYLQQQRAMSSFRRSLGYTALYSADLLDWFRVHLASRLGELMPWRRGHGAFWPGLVAVSLGGVAAWRTWRSRAERVGAWGYVLCLGLAGFLLAFGPVPHVAGLRLWIPLPYAALYYLVPGFASMRAPSRFAALAILALALLAARAYDALRASNVRGRRWLVALVWVLGVGETVSVPLGMVPLPDPARLPAVYRWLARQPGDFAIVEVPMPASQEEESERDALRQLVSLYHGKARLDGVSGFSPPAHERFRAAMREFPAATAIDAARVRGASYVVVRFAELDGAQAARLRASIRGDSGLEPVAAFGSDVVYRLGRAGSASGR